LASNTASCAAFKRKSFRKCGLSLSDFCQFSHCSHYSASNQVEEVNEMMVNQLAPLIAIVGTDGSGKTTVSSAVIEFVRRYGPADTAHLGLKSGDVGRAIQRLPLIGKSFDAYITRKASRARDKKDKIPGPVTALVIYAFSALRVRRFKRMMRKRRAGQIIVTDRYPQIDVVGFYDGPGLSAAKAGDRFTRWLAEREYRQYAWMASFHPNLVIRLNVDLETAFARKPDHKLESLRQKVEATPKLTFGGAPIVDFDSKEPLATIINKVETTIAPRLEALGLTAR
jgi:thymidylate kinase